MSACVDRVLSLSRSSSETVVAAAAGSAVVAGLFAWYAKGLPEFTDVSQYRPKLASKVFSVDGRLIGEFYEERRIVVPYEQIPKRLVQAFIAAEDKKFFDHVSNA
jgi:penicillin-binding protein 1A